MLRRGKNVRFTRRGFLQLAAGAVALAWAFPGESRPAAASPWAPLHWVLGLASYGLFGVAVLHAVMLDSAEPLGRIAMLRVAPQVEPQQARRPHDQAHTTGHTQQHRQAVQGIRCCPTPHVVVQRRDRGGGDAARGDAAARARARFSSA